MRQPLAHRKAKSKSSFGANPHCNCIIPGEGGVQFKGKESYLGKMPFLTSVFVKHPIHNIKRVEKILSTQALMKRPGLWRLILMHSFGTIITPLPISIALIRDRAGGSRVEGKNTHTINTVHSCSTKHSYTHIFPPSIDPICLSNEHMPTPSFTTSWYPKL